MQTHRAPSLRLPSGAEAYPQILRFMRDEWNVSRLSAWEVHEMNLGPQPQWLFDAVNAFLDGT